MAFVATRSTLLVVPAILAAGCALAHSGLAPTDAVVDGDESTLAHGTTAAFYACTSHNECVPGTVCVDNGGDGRFYCKPVCSGDGECAGYPFPSLRCHPAVRQDGTTFQRGVCNDSPGVLHPI